MRSAAAEVAKGICRAALQSSLRLFAGKSLARRCVLLGSTADTEEEGAKIVQLAGKADPQGSKEPAKDTPKVRTLPVLFFLGGVSTHPRVTAQGRREG